MTYVFEVRTMEAGLGGRYTKTVETTSVESAWVALVGLLETMEILPVVVSLTLVEGASQ